MYNSPIRIITSDLGMKVTEALDEQIYQSVLNVGIDVDKGELLRALQYDREQYDKGYADGEADAMAAIVRCKDCDFCYYNSSSGTYRCSTHNGMNRTVEPDEFCSWAERRIEDGQA